LKPKEEQKQPPKEDDSKGFPKQEDYDNVQEAYNQYQTDTTTKQYNEQYYNNNLPENDQN